MKKQKPQPLGTIGITRASLLNKGGKVIAHCLDTPNAIAKALMRVPEAAKVKSILGVFSRGYYRNRMKSWNKARSGLVRVK